MNKFKIFIELILNFLFISFLILPLWLNKKFGFVYLDQFMIHFEMEMLGLIDGDTKLYKSGIKWLLIYPFIFSIFILFLRNVISNSKLNLKQVLSKIQKFVKKVYKFKRSLIGKFILSFLNFFLLKRVYLIVIFLLSIFFYSNYTNFFKSSFNKNDNKSYLDQNYKEPQIDGIAQKNLIVIYSESLESTYSNKFFFEQDLIKEINNHKNLQSVLKYYQVPGTGYSLHSLIASQCGVPLLNLGLLRNIKHDNVKRFLPNLTCLTDILHQKNYKNILITSDNSESGGYDAFANTHKYDEIIDLDRLAKLGYKTSRRAWHFYKKNWYGGIHDNILYKALLDTIKKNYGKGHKFFISAHTLDLHSPKGYPNPECLKEILSKENKNTFDYKDSVKCSSKYLSEFIDEFKKLKLKNTSLVIMGDHLFMGDIGVPKNKRHIYNSFLTEENLVFQRELINVFDFFPTLINLTGLKIKNKASQAGIGFSIFQENLDYKKLNFQLKNNSNLYKNFWYE